MLALTAEDIRLLGCLYALGIRGGDVSVLLMMSEDILIDDLYI